MRRPFIAMVLLFMIYFVATEHRMHLMQVQLDGVQRTVEYGNAEISKQLQAISRR